jgi:hypothetical protein
MKKPFSEWAVDGQISLILILVSLACILFAQFADKKRNYIAKKSGDFLQMKPINSSKVVLYGAFLLCLLVSYAVLQSGHCSTMTPSKNANNQLIGIVLAIILWSGLLFSAYKLFLHRYSFNKKQINISTPFSKEILKWDDLLGIGADWRGNYLEFLNSEKFYYPYGVSGFEQLENILNSKISNLENPQIPYYNEEGIKYYLDKSVILIKFSVDDIGIEKIISSEIGYITDVRKEKITIVLRSGELISASANLRSLDLFDDDEYYPDDLQKILSPLIEAKDKPEIIAIYYIENE